MLHKKLSWKIFCCCVALLAACSKEEVKSPHKAPPVLVSAVTVHKANIEIPYNYVGVLEPVAEAKIVAQISGILESHKFIEGKYVKKGDVLFILDGKKYQMQLVEAKAKLDQAQIAFDQAQKEEKRAKELQKQKALSDMTTEQVIVKAQEAQSKLKQAKSSYDMAVLNLEYSKVKAPIDGIISQQLISDGSLVSAGSTILAQITKNNKLYVNFSLSAIDYMEIRQLLNNMPKKPNILQLRIYNKGTLYKERAVVDFASPLIDQNTGTVKVRAIIDNKDHDLIAGQFVRIILEGIKYPGIKIPEQALLQDQNSMYVFILESDKEGFAAKKIDVKIFKQLPDRSWLLSAEDKENTATLKDGDKIIITGHNMLQSYAMMPTAKANNIAVHLTHLDGKEIKY